MKKRALTGAHAVAEAMRQINPEVVAAYPITPQTPIVEKFAKFVADGKVDTEMIPVESEHSAMSAVVGASAAGTRAMTATSAVGLALMFEVVNAASGLRLPIVMPVANRALSAPINIHCDHSDTMACRDAGWIQIYSENAQEAYENTILAVRLAEHLDVLLPVMVMQDGFVTSHSVENVRILPDNTVRKFVKTYRPKRSLLDTDNPRTIGAFFLPDYLFESKRQEAEGMKKAKKIYLEVGKELSKITGNEYPYFEKYQLDDADVVIITANSTAGTTKAVIDKLRKEGKKVGLLKIKLFRPFPYKEVSEALKGVKSVAVLERSMSFGANAPVFGEIKNTLPGIEMQSCIFGLGGRDIFENEIEKVFEDLLAGKMTGPKYIGCRGCE